MKIFAVLLFAVAVYLGVTDGLIVGSYVMPLRVADEAIAARATPSFDDLQPLSNGLQGEEHAVQLQGSGLPVRPFHCFIPMSLEYCQSMNGQW